MQFSFFFSEKASFCLLFCVLDDFEKYKEIEDMTLFLLK